MKRNRALYLKLLKIVALAALVVLLARRGLEKHLNPSRFDEIKVVVPFRSIFPIDPRAIESVGDQVLCEHLFAFHSRESIRAGFQPVFSNVLFDYQSNRVGIKPIHAVMSGDGGQLSDAQICDSIRNVFKGTKHQRYSSLVRSIDCASNEISIHFSTIPANLQFLFTLPDLSIFDTKTLPITETGQSSSTGPYRLERVDGTTSYLTRNKFYPKALVANEVERVRISSYSSSEVDALVSTINPHVENLVYFFGHALSPELEEVLKLKGYRLNSFPSEWVVLLSYGSQTSRVVRESTRRSIDEDRKKMRLTLGRGQVAYSLSPADRPYGLQLNEYEVLATEVKRTEQLRKPVAIGTLKSWEQIPIFKEIRRNLSKNFPEANFKSYDSNEYGRMLSESDICIRMLGISPADPLSHLTFLQESDENVRQFVDETVLAKLAMISSADEFSSSVKRYERLLVANDVILPIAHFPGIVAEAPGFSRDEALAWSWGIQAWTYRIR